MVITDSIHKYEQDVLHDDYGQHGHCLSLSSPANSSYVKLLKCHMTCMMDKLKCSSGQY